MTGASGSVSHMRNPFPSPIPDSNYDSSTVRGRGRKRELYGVLQWVGVRRERAKLQTCILNQVDGPFSGLERPLSRRGLGYEVYGEVNDTSVYRGVGRDLHPPGTGFRSPPWTDETARTLPLFSLRITGLRVFWTGLALGPIDGVTVHRRQ